MRLASSILVFCVAALLALGIIMLYSSSMMQVGAHYLTMQAIWCLLGLVAGGVLAATDYRRLKKFSWILYVLVLILLALVLAPSLTHSHRINGATRWIGTTVHIQPSELAKLVMVIVIAHYGERFQRQMSGFWRGLVIPGLIIVPILALILMEPDYGTAILIGCCAVTLMLVAGSRPWQVGLCVTAAMACLVFAISRDTMRHGRIDSWLHPEQTRLGKGLQAWQAMVALGSGGLTGLGLGEGRQKMGYVPEHHTDFIYSIIGEELGLAGTLGVLGLFIAVVAAGISIAGRAGDAFGLLLGGGITFIIGFQAFINMGVVTSVLPNKGMPLPFISYGGSNLAVMLLMVGVLLSIARHSSESEASAATTVGEPLPAAA